MRVIKLLLFLVILSLFFVFVQYRGSAVKDVVLIGFTGDLMLGRLVNEAITEKGYVYPWGDILQELKKTDLNIVNLETTFTKSEKKVSKVFNFKASPDKVQTLRLGRIDVVNLANNHVLDFSEEGLFETLSTLRLASIQHVGAGEDINEARRPVIITKKGVKIGILGCTDNEAGWKAEKNKAGINYIQVGDMSAIEEDIKALRSQVDIVVVSMHWGPNMRQVPSKKFVNFAHQMIDAGVDVFHGHSAHILQGVEVYKKKIIMYDTGDFVDDYRVDPVLRNDHSFFFLVEVDEKGVRRLSLTPVLISNMQVNRAQGEDKEEIISTMKHLSSSFGTVFQETDGKLVVSLW